MFTEPEVNNCFRVIAQVLSSSVVNRFVVETILLQLAFNRFKYFDQQKLHIFLLKSVTPNLEVSFVLFRVVFSFISLITPCVTWKKREAAILKFSIPALIT